MRVDLGHGAPSHCDRIAAGDLRDLRRRLSVEVTPVLLTRPSAAADSSDALIVPRRYVLHRLDPTGATLAMPQDWYFTAHAVHNGWRWTLTQEDPASGPYDTGLALWLVLGAGWPRGPQAQSVAQEFLAEKRQAACLLEEQSVPDVGELRGHGIEVVQMLWRKGIHRSFRIRYSAYWSTPLHIVLFSAFGAPIERWSAAEPIANATGRLRLQRLLGSQ